MTREKTINYKGVKYFDAGKYVSVMPKGMLGVQVGPDMYVVTSDVYKKLVKITKQVG